MKLPQDSFNSQESIDGSAKNANFVRPTQKLWLKGALILALSPTDLVIPVCQSRTYGQGLPPVMLNFLKPKMSRIESGLVNFQKTGSDRTRGVLPKKS